MSGGSINGGASLATLDQARAAKQQAADSISRFSDVVGVGIVREGDAYTLKVNIRDLLPAGVEVPEMVQGVPVRVEVVGTVQKQGIPRKSAG